MGVNLDGFGNFGLASAGFESLLVCLLVEETILLPALHAHHEIKSEKKKKKLWFLYPVFPPVEVFPSADWKVEGSSRGSAE